MFKKIRNVHFVGVGGAGMSGIAEVLLTLGYAVTGSDAKASDVTRRLTEMGARVFLGHRAEQVAGAHVVVTSTAVRPDNPEVIEAFAQKIPVIPRIEMLAELARLKYTIAVGGTHGKTTTTSLISLVLNAGGLDPTVVVGGRMHNLGTGARVGRGDYLVAEADESDGSFLKLAPTLAIVTNIDDDHLDYWGTLSNLVAGFEQFANKVPFYGRVILGVDDVGARKILEKIRRPLLTYGVAPDAEIQARDIRPAPEATVFSVYRNDKKLGEIRWSAAGRHNVINSLAAVAVGMELDIPFTKIAEALASFQGVSRRLERIGERGGVVVMDDYGHHPTEIKATLQALKEKFPDRRAVVVFQPHRYSRTRILADEFAACFSRADVLGLLDIYAASEAPVPGVTSDWLADRIRAQGTAVTRLPAVEGPARLRELVKSGDVVLTLGAGDVWKWGGKFVGVALLMPSLFAEELRFLFPALKTDEPLSRHTSWGIGGPADYYLEIRNQEELKKIFVWTRSRQIPLTPLGQGSNLLVSDKGIRGVTFRLRGDFESLRFEGDRVVAGGGVLLPHISRAAAERGLAGAEPFCGIPGTVGGALQTNAGTPEGDIGRLVREVYVLDASGHLLRCGRDDIHFSYRRSSLAGQIVVSVDLQLRAGNKNDILAVMDQQLKRRAERQPLGTKNCGSVFKNPPGDHAARLIEAVGLKGFRVGGAQVSPKHANFIENVDHATASDVQTLIGALQSAVRQRFGIELELEVWTVGDV